MLFLKNRLRKKQDFERVYKNGRYVSGEGMGIRFVENALCDSRIGFVVSAKFSKKAVERNKIKRQLRSIFEKKVKTFKKEIDMIVIPQKAKKRTFLELKNCVEAVLKRANII